MTASDDYQWLLIAALSPSCALPLPLPPGPLDGTPDRTPVSESPFGHRLALVAGVALAVLPVLVAALA
ncbi:hypothetical protein FBZ82_102342 [Azospirillum brasilense]|uniref:Uncharacterized protein n=1 Tax=Azospirillum brasilense TaxID=192 RepID=A0A560BJG6_AZOBR|nr:hypothetical protein [Azospirillum brasilense]TWA72742.1 hypothetical protein FBZ82_102342 [Azospirillum brasilense]